MINLKPCPFCGGKAHVIMMDEEGCEITYETYESDHDEGQTYDEWLALVLAGYCVICDKCNAYLPDYGWLSKETVIGKWNTRTIKEVLQ